MSFFFQAEDGIRVCHVTGVQTCALPISPALQNRSDIAPWCNWQHASLWMRRVLVRAQEGQLRHASNACKHGRGGRVAYGGALLRRWVGRPAWVRIPPPPL